VAIAESDRQTFASPLDTADEHGLVLGDDSMPQGLSNLHPTLPTLRKMWDIYVDRVDPLVKILHLPTFWPTLINALQTPQEIPSSLEALVFAFYYATSSACEDSECQSVMGERQVTVSIRYKRAARQALINAGFLRTTNVITLQAFVLFLVSGVFWYLSSSNVGRLERKAIIDLTRCSCYLESQFDLLVEWVSIVMALH